MSATAASWESEATAPLPDRVPKRYPVKCPHHRQCSVLPRVQNLTVVGVCMRAYGATGQTIRSVLRQSFDADLGR